MAYKQKGQKMNTPKAKETLSDKPEQTSEQKPTQAADHVCDVPGCGVQSVVIDADRDGAHRYCYDHHMGWCQGLRIKDMKPIAQKA